MGKCHKWCTSRLGIGTYAVHTYVWDAPQVVKCIVSMFADDTTLYILTDHNSNLKLNDLPHLEYASYIWFPKLKEDYDAIERIQHRVTKLVPELHTLIYTECLGS